jgi:hypothetical protein
VRALGLLSYFAGREFVPQLLDCRIIKAHTCQEVEQPVGKQTESLMGIHDKAIDAALIVVKQSRIL